MHGHILSGAGIVLLLTSLTAGAEPPSRFAVEDAATATPKPTSPVAAKPKHVLTAAAPLAAPAAIAPERKPAPPAPTLMAKIDLSSQQMTVMVGGQLHRQWPVSTARAGYVTPTGTYRAQRLERMWYSRKYDMSPMPHSVFFHGGYAVHATYAVRMLGRTASHGCVRLAPAAAAEFYGLVKKHGMAQTRIVIHGSPRRGEPKVASSQGGSRATRSALPGTPSAPARRAQPSPMPRPAILRSSYQPMPVSRPTWPGDTPRYR